MSETLKVQSSHVDTVRQDGDEWNCFVSRLTTVRKQDNHNVSAVSHPPMRQVRRPPSSHVSGALCPETVRQGVGETGQNVIAGPWKPSTPEEVTEERRRVVEEEPRLWWWKPRYRLADLERAGMDHADAVDQVRAEFATSDGGSR